MKLKSDVAAAVFIAIVFASFAGCTAYTHHSDNLKEIEYRKLERMESK